MTAKSNASRPRRAKRPRLRIVVTAGPTREYFDAVRFISNPSSGKMGYAIAKAAAEAGHDVTLISGPVEISPPPGIRVVRVVSAAEMAAATKVEFRQADAAIFAAAVCDYAPTTRAVRKPAKSSRPIRLSLRPTEDIAAACGRVKDSRITICFAMETHNGRAHAEAKLRLKRCDAIVLNGLETVSSDRIQAQFHRAGKGWELWPPAAKSVVAHRLIQALTSMAVELSSSATTMSKP